MTLGWGKRPWCGGGDGAYGDQGWIRYNRHRGRANYLYTDGHEESWLLVTTASRWTARRIRDRYALRTDIEEQIRHDGSEAAADLGIHDLHPELIRLLGTLKFRTSYGQNVLKHSVEVATI